MALGHGWAVIFQEVGNHPNGLIHVLADGENAVSAAGEGGGFHAAGALA